MPKQRPGQSVLRTLASLRRSYDQPLKCEVEEMLLKIESISMLSVAIASLDLPDTAVRGSRERLKAAVRNCSYPFPRTGAGHG